MKSIFFNVINFKTFLNNYHVSNSQSRLLTCLHDQYKSGFLEGRLLSSQSELFENLSDWLEKSGPSKKAAIV